MSNYERFEEIQYEIIQLTKEAFDLLPTTHDKDRARGYWYNSIINSVNGNSMCSMDDSKLSIDDEDIEDDVIDEDEV